MKRNAVFITGQTATGKTKHAIKLANEKKGEIVSADSRQVYARMDIITGKDVSEKNYTDVDRLILEGDRTVKIGYYTISNIRVWGYDLVTPDTHFSSFDYKVVAHYILRNAMDESSLPIVVGGSYLYIKDLIDDFDNRIPPNWEYRNKMETLSLEELQKRLKIADEKMYDTLNNSDRNNPRRLIRRLEIINADKTNNQRFNKIVLDQFIGLKYANDNSLVTAIKKRVKNRIDQGAVSEVREITKKYSKNCPGLQTIGYQHIIKHLEGRISKEEAIQLWITAEVQYAKRQYTFMKKDKKILWKEVDI